MGVKALTRAQLILSAYGLDVIAGDPEWFPHPVRLMGCAITKGEVFLRGPNCSPRADLVSGALLTTSVVVSSYFVAKLLLKFTKHFGPLGNPLEISLAWTCIAARSLHCEASSVLVALDVGDLETARHRLSRIVGRDTLNLNEPEISRAVIETVAESLSDGIMAPLLYLAIGGIPLTFAYKAVNTLDSMIGHADDRYFYFGKFAARLDDVANLVPARLSALAIHCAAWLIPACDATRSVSTWKADHARHKSPNAGHPESAMAGALGVRLGGQNRYAGQQVLSPYLGVGFESPSPRTAHTSLTVAALATLLGLAVFALLSSRLSKEALP